MAVWKLSAFTLIELLLVLIIFSILSLLIIPSYFGYQNRQAISLKAWEIKTALQLARSIAIAEYTQIKACPASLNYKCLSDLGAKFLVFQDINNNHQWDKNEPIYKDISIEQFKTQLSASGRSFIRFKPSGESMESGNLAICDPGKTDFAKRIIFFHSGRVRLSKDNNADGYDEESGQKLTCEKGSLTPK